MNDLSLFARRALVGCAVAGLLTGCGELQPRTAWEPIPRGQAIAASAHIGQSWMLPEAKGEDLLYVSFGQVNVYSYPKTKLVGVLRGLHSTGDACSDDRGNVWIIQNETTLLEYAHGSRRPIYALGVPVGMNAAGCAVDPTSGNLAVIGNTSARKPGTIAVYPGASGTPTLYKWKYLAYSGTYDTNGDLFIDGAGYNESPEFAAAELHKGSDRLKLVSFGSQTYSLCFYPGPVRWDGTHLVVGCANEYSAWTIHDNTATPAGGAFFNNAYQLNDLWIAGSRVIVSSSEGSGSIPPIQIYKYPAAGNPIKVITQGVESGAVTVSVGGLRSSETKVGGLRR
jgi:hypothetical protein